ncbi:hypothetical protein [Vibrio phage vB_pir03]|nr:hypothetical protein [Vibrio phage vB_pir03]
MFLVNLITFNEAAFGQSHSFLFSILPTWIMTS